MAVFASGLAAASWILGENLVFSIGWTVAAAGYFGTSWYARRHANAPLRPGRGATSRWGGGDPTNGGNSSEWGRSARPGVPEAAVTDTARARREAEQMAVSLCSRR